MPMRFLVDADVPKAIVDVLRSEGHDVVYAATELPQKTQDATMLAQAVAERRLLIVADKDYSGYIYQDHLTAPNEGIIYLRLPKSMLPEERAQLVSALLRAHPTTDFVRQFVTVRGLDHVRFRPFPQ